MWQMIRLMTSIRLVPPKWVQRDAEDRPADSTLGSHDYGVSPVLPFAITVSLFLDIMWVVCYVILRATVDMPMGPTNIWLHGSEYDESVKRNFESQRRMFQFWRTWMKWIAIAGTLLMVVLLIVSGSL